jgi:hypothetical protein
MSASKATHGVIRLLGGRVGCFMRADDIAFFGEDGKYLDFLATLLHKPISQCMS